jgi:hypothetical protein
MVARTHTHIQNRTMKSPVTALHWAGRRVWEEVEGDQTMYSASLSVIVTMTLP